MQYTDVFIKGKKLSYLALPNDEAAEGHVEAAADEEDGGGQDVYRVELHAGHHGHHHQAGELGEGEEAGEGRQVVAQPPGAAPGGGPVHRVVHGGQRQPGPRVQRHHQRPHTPLRRGAPDRS